MTDDVFEKPITKCEDCGKLYLKFDHIPLEQPCPHCKEKTDEKEDK